jgi:RNA polymerase sigma factor (sigma-70 family)
MAETDENLMLAVRDGELSKLGALFERHHRALFDFFARMTGSRVIAEDLVQEVFLRILKYRGTFRGDSRFKVWMFHIARNVRIDHYRRSPREEFLHENGAAALRCSESSAAVRLERREHILLLECALLRLPEDKREVLILSRYQDMKYEQIAQVMGCETGAVKVRVHRALKALRDIFMKLVREKLPCNAKQSENSLQIM